MTAASSAGKAGFFVVLDAVLDAVFGADFGADFELAGFARVLLRVVVFDFVAISLLGS
ncbi:hypothetical protein [Aliiroseovarius crassostreae]|uniref:hypothetical protein n=1 Tax=Aliiroseovarius crassostreae TaxID=154981 RepID=UPI003C7B3992